MKIHKKAVTIVEAVVVLLIISLGVVGIYKIYSNSIRFLDGVEAKIQAIQIAREGIEAVENIRATNWQLFGSNTKDCWNVLEYKKDCIGNSLYPNKFGKSTTKENYRISKGTKNRWYLQSPATSSENYNTNDYKSFYKIIKDTDGLYKHGSGDEIIDFTRRIEIIGNQPIKYLDSYGRTREKNKGILIKSIVEWRDMSSSGVRKIVLENTMTNYKK